MVTLSMLGFILKKNRAAEDGAPSAFQGWRILTDSKTSGFPFRRFTETKLTADPPLVLLDDLQQLHAGFLDGVEDLQGG